MKKYKLLGALGFSFVIGLMVLWFTFDKPETKNDLSNAGMVNRHATSFTSSHDEDALASNRIDALKSDLVSLQVQIVQIRNMLLAQQQNTDKSITAKDLDMSGNKISKEDDVVSMAVSEAAEREQAVAQVDLLENQLQQEAPDAAWSDWAENEIMTKINDRGYTGMNVVGSECRTSMCRLELQFDDSVNRDETLGDIPSIVPWDSQGFFHADEQDPLKMVIYISRDGEQLAKVK